MTIPPLRIARITTMTQYNKTKSASDVEWAWKPVVSEQLQFLNDNNEWQSIPVVEVFDNSAKEQEEQDKKDRLNASKSKDLHTYQLLSSMTNLDTYWHKIEDSSQFYYLLDFERAQFNFNKDKDGYFYYLNDKGPVARVINDDRFVRGDILLHFLRP